LVAGSGDDFVSDPDPGGQTSMPRRGRIVLKLKWTRRTLSAEQTFVMSVPADALADRECLGFVETSRGEGIELLLIEVLRRSHGVLGKCENSH